MHAFSTAQFVILSLGWGAACFFIYFLFLRSSTIQSWFQLQFGADTGRLRHAITAKLLGALTMGLGTLWFSYELFGRLFDEMLGLYWSDTGWPENILLLVLAGLMFFFSFRRRNSEELLINYPETRLYRWNAGMMWTYLSAWLIYLIGYEILFRGLLLIALIPYLGIYWALGLHVIIYILVHLHKNREELLGSAIFALGIGYFCAVTASIVPALFLHLIVSLSTNYFAITNRQLIDNG